MRILSQMYPDQRDREREREKNRKIEKERKKEKGIPESGSRFTIHIDTLRR